MAIERSIRINVEAGRAKAELRSLQGSLRDTDRSASAAATATRALGAAVAGFASIATIRQVANYADTYTQLQNQLKLVTNSTQELTSVTGSLFSVAQSTRNSFEGTADLYSRLARSTRDLGVSNERLLSVTETVNKAIAASGTNAQTAQASLFQLGQGLSAGALRGEELNSVLEGTSRLGQAIADGLTGGSIPALRELASQGELTAQRVIEALENQAKIIDKEYAQTSSTIEQAFTKINNELIKYIGEADKANNITQNVTAVLGTFAENFADIADTVGSVAVPAFTALAAVVGGRLAGALAASTKATASNIAVSIAQGKAIAQNAAFEADRAAAVQFATFATLQKIKSEEAATLASLNSVKAVQTQLVAERQLEVVRLQAQITDTGRAASLARLAEIRTAEAATTAQATAAEAANAAAKAKTTAAYNAFTAASGLATAATAAHSKALKATTLAANVGALAVRGFNSALALVGGPAGVAVIAAAAIGLYVASLESAEERTKRVREETDAFVNALEGASIIQFTTALFNAEEAADGARTELANARSELERLVSVGAESSKVTEDLRVKISQLEANVVNAEQEVNRISNTFQDAAQSAREFAGAASGEDNTKNPELLAAAYKKLKGELDEATKIQNEFEETIKQINKDFPEGEKNIELVRLAEKKRGEDLKRLNDRTKKAADRNAKLHRSYQDLRGEFDPLAKVQFEYKELLKEIDNSTASATEKETLRALAVKQLKENLDDATTTGQEFLAQFDKVAAAEVRRTELLRQLEKVQASAAERQKLSAEIQRQYNKEVDDAIPSFIELNAQFSAADASTAAYVNTLKDLDEAQRLGVDVTELRANALKAYQKAAEEARKQDRLNEETSQSFFGAFAQGIGDAAITAENQFDAIRRVGRESIQGLADQITQFVTTGEADFKGFASSVITELLKIQTQALIVQGLTSIGLGGAFGLTAARGAAFDGGMQKFARGGASLPLGSFSNSVVSTPTKFAAGGTLGQMGEAGAEAILPLQRTAGGELGVNTSGMAQQQPAPVNVDVPVQVINVTERPQDYLGSDAGVKQIVNIMTQNKAALQS